MIYLISQVFLAWTFLNCLAHYAHRPRRPLLARLPTGRSPRPASPLFGLPNSIACLVFSRVIVVLREGMHIKGYVFENPEGSRGTGLPLGLKLTKE